MRALLILLAALPNFLVAQAQETPPSPGAPATRIINRPRPPVAGQPPRPGLPDGQSEAPARLSENYRVAVTIAEKDVPTVELAVVTASPRFTASITEQGLAFEGALSIEESGALSLEYVLAWTTPVPATELNNTGGSSVRQSRITSSVRLTVDEPVQIFRAGSRTVTLTIQPAKSVNVESPH